MSASSSSSTGIEENLPLKAVEFFVLAVLTDGERHGYGIVKEITSRTGGKVRVRPGNLYRVIDRLMERGLVKATGQRTADSSSGARRYYGVTSIGRKVAAAHVELITDVVEASSEL
jgi:DNA-binding PadR family transcriptional regulator